MAPRWWYLRHGVAWSPLLGSCGAALAAAGALSRWPSTAVVLLPALLACCAAGAGFAFDERATAVVAVTPRGAGWRRTTRLAAAAVPLVVWVAVVLVRPGDLPLDRWAWWSVGAAALALASGVAALASRRLVESPGSLLASAAALTVMAPVVVSGFLGWESVYPMRGFAASTWTFWCVVAAGGLAAWAVALRPGIRA